MPDQSTDDARGDSPTRWVQTRLFGEREVHATLHFAILEPADHVQAMVEVRQPSGGELLGMVSWPHRPVKRWRSTLEEVLDELAELLEAIR